MTTGEELRESAFVGRCARNNDTQMKSRSGIMSHTSKEEYLESCRQRYPSRNRAGKSTMLDEVIDTLGWDRKHTIKALNGRVAHGKEAKRRGSKPTYGPAEQAVIVAIWKYSEQPCGARLKQTLPLWIDSYQARHGRKTGRASNRIQKFVPIRCGPQAFDEPGWLKADTVSHGGGSSSGAFLWSLTLNDFHSGWTELAALWGNSGGEVRVGLERIEKRLPFPMLGFDCDNGSELLNEVIEAYLLRRSRSIEWTRSRAYKKNDQAHVEQKNFTHVRQLLGYGRFGDLELREQVNDLYEKAWLPLRNHFTPVMKLIEKQRIGSEVRKKYDIPAKPCDRLLACAKVSEETKIQLRATRRSLDPMDLAADIEERLRRIFTIVEYIEEDRLDEMTRAGEPAPRSGAAGAENLVKSTPKNQNQTKCRVL